MAMPRTLATWHNRVTNRLMRRYATMLPGYGLVEHAGRRSGRTHRTPLNVFPVDGGFAIVVAYGPRTDWLRNLQAADGGELVHRRCRYRLSAPRLVTGSEAVHLLPFYGRLISRMSGERVVLVVCAVPI